ncbi:hypothetical protein Esti_002511 [Eimeria stiedai]
MFNVPQPRRLLLGLVKVLGALEAPGSPLRVPPRCTGSYRWLHASPSASSLARLKSYYSSSNRYNTSKATNSSSNSSNSSSSSSSSSIDSSSKSSSTDPCLNTTTVGGPSQAACESNRGRPITLGGPLLQGPLCGPSAAGALLINEHIQLPLVRLLQLRREQQQQQQQQQEPHEQQRWPGLLKGFAASVVGDFPAAEALRIAQQQQQQLLLLLPHARPPVCVLVADLPHFLKHLQQQQQQQQQHEYCYDPAAKPKCYRISTNAGRKDRERLLQQLRGTLQQQRRVHLEILGAPPIRWPAAAAAAADRVAQLEQLVREVVLQTRDLAKPTNLPLHVAAPEQQQQQKQHQQQKQQQQHRTYQQLQQQQLQQVAHLEAGGVPRWAPLMRQLAGGLQPPSPKHEWLLAAAEAASVIAVAVETVEALAAAATAAAPTAATTAAATATTTATTTAAGRKRGLCGVFPLPCDQGFECMQPQQRGFGGSLLLLLDAGC